MKKLTWAAVIFCGTLLGCSTYLFELSYDPKVRDKIQTFFMNELSSGLECTLHGELTQMNLVTGVLEFSRVFARDAKRLFYWQADKVTVRFSWWHVLFSRVFKLTIHLDNLKAQSHVHENNIVLKEHIKKWIDLPEGPLPTKIHSLSIRSGRIELIDKVHRVQALCKMNIHLAVTRDAVKISCAYSEGTVCVAAKPLVDMVAGSMYATVNRETKHYHADVTMATWLPVLNRTVPQCLMSGKIKNNTGQFSLCTDDRKIDCQISINNDQIACQGAVAGEYLVDAISLISSKELVKPELLQGSCFFSFFINGATMHCTGSLSCANGFYNHYQLPHISCSYEFNKDRLSGDCTVEYEGLIFNGPFTWDKEANTGSLNLTNTVSIDRWGVIFQPQEILAKLTYASSQLKGSVKAQTYEGSFELDDKKAHFSINEGNKRFLIKALPKPLWHMSSCEYRVDGNKVMYLRGKPDNSFEAEIAFKFVQDFIKKLYNVEIVGTGSIKVSGALRDDSRIAFHGQLKKATIRVPHVYNIVHDIDIDGHIDYRARCLYWTKMTCVLNKGELRSSHGCLMVDDTYKPIFYYVPLLFHDCFVHWRKDLMGTVSGFLTLKNDLLKKPSIEGQVILDKAHIQSNMLSSKFETDFAHGVTRPFTHYDADLDVHFISRSPVTVKTSFLNADSHIKLDLKGTIANPEVSGKVSIAQGNLNFPYQPLYITRGFIYFLPHQLHDPLIELTAKNKIKKYAITMSVAGSLRQPKIMFDASPHLSEGQIVTLLLGGSDDGSLFLAMPSSLMNTVENLVFGPAESTSQVQRYLHSLFKPFKSVRIVPRFSDESGRGGIRGSLMIEVNDNLRATIQNNFNLSEDTRIEVEYGLSDNTVIRGVKDERGDLGAELEKTWKFGG